MSRGERPRVGALVTYVTGGREHHGVVRYYPLNQGGVTFPVQDLLAPYGYIQSWPGDPRVLEIDGVSVTEGVNG